MGTKKKTEKTKLRRSCNTQEFRAAASEDGKKYLEGYAAVYNSETMIGDCYKEIIERGAFDGCDLSDVSLFTNHQSYRIPLARCRKGDAGSTMQIEVDGKGLHFKAELDTENNSEARQLYSSVERGDIKGMSFAFLVGKETWEDQEKEIPTRRISKITKTFEISAVNDPAYEETDINARAKQELEAARREVEEQRNSIKEAYKLKNKILGDR